jgi:hypothetical protein
MHKSRAIEARAAGRSGKDAGQPPGQVPVEFLAALVEPVEAAGIEDKLLRLARLVMKNTGA